MRGKAPGAPSEQPQAKDQVSLTDEESRIMPTHHGFQQTYNAQASVDIATHLIVGHHVSQHTNDLCPRGYKQEIEPALATLKQLPDCLGIVETLLADTGYFSQGNVKACGDATIKPYIAQKRQRHNQSLDARFQQAPDINETPLPPVEAMTHRLATKAGKALCSKRKSTVETVFGIIKHVLGFRQFHLQGLASVQSEWNLVCIGWNLKRMLALKG